MSGIAIKNDFALDQDEERICDIMTLSKEIHALIISKLDGISLVRTQKVCRLWYDIVADFEKYFHIWLRCCLTEIPTYDLVEITGLLEIEESEDVVTTAENLKKLPSFFWREVYAEYHRCNFIKNDRRKVTDISFFKGYGMVTALKFRDNMLFSGHEDGRVLCWENIDTCLESRMCHQHQRMVTDIAVTRAGLTVHHLFLGLNNVFVISSSQDSTLILNDVTAEKSTKITHFSKQVNSVSCRGLTFVAAANCSYLQGHPVWDIDYNSNLQARLRCHQDLVGQESTNITSIALHGNRILAADYLGNLFLYKGKEKGQNTEQQKPTILKTFGAAVKKMIFREDKVVCLTDDGMLWISHDLKEFTQQSVYEALNVIPECVAWRVSIFAVGAKTGKVFLYQMKDDNDLLNIDLSNPVCTCEVDADHVNDITIGDDGNGPVVAIATEHSTITVFRWSR